ncbi:hypothetical protein COO60DRAFT_635459 [Scenedesmus sp. NREL 46B-D3]|nr:hypothetical protein COO60DRAFT_635459 [Scenedesmus sp. NREL 46B-D3]
MLQLSCNICYCPLAGWSRWLEPADHVAGQRPQPAAGAVCEPCGRGAVAEETVKDWQHPPFSGAVADGHVWGRGALDIKGAAMGLLEAATALLQEGFQPRRTLLIALGHDEEVGGAKGAAQMAALLAARA